MPSENKSKQTQVKKLKSNWHTHFDKEPQPELAQILEIMASKSIVTLKKSSVLNSIMSWIGDCTLKGLSNKVNNYSANPQNPSWISGLLGFFSLKNPPENQNKRPLGNDELALQLAEAISQVIINSYLSRDHSQFVKLTISHLAQSISNAIAEKIIFNLMVPETAFALEEVIQHLLRNETNEAKKINESVKNMSLIDTTSIQNLENKFSQKELESTIERLELQNKAKLKELDRIKKTHPKDIVQRLYQGNMRNNMGEEIDSKYNNDYKIMLAHALEIKALYKNTHYTFIHGQRLEPWIYLKFTKILMRKFFPEKNLSYFNLLKLNNLSAEKKPACFYLNESSHNDHHIEARKQLLSVDGFFFHRFAGESASRFCQANSNVFKGSLKPFLELFVKENLQIREDQFGNVIEQVAQVASEFNQLSDTGNLIVISIPKDKASYSVYESHQCGEPCKDNEAEDTLENSNINKQRLEALQNDCDVNEQIAACKWTRENLALDRDSEKAVTQYRVVVNNLDPEETCILMLSPLAQSLRNSYKHKLQQLAEQLFSQSAHRP